DLNFEKKDPTGEDTYLSSFIVWIYNEKPMDKQLRFEFLKDGKKCSSFPFGLNFKGWRAAWVCYERDMEGTPEEKMNELRIVAPNEAGKLFIDHLITGVKTDQRHQTADLQMPFLNAKTQSHWLVILNRSKLMPDISLEANVSTTQQKDIKAIEERFRTLIFTPGKLTNKAMDNIRKEYAKYEIVYKDGKVSGLPLFYTYAREAYERLISGWTKEIIVDSGMGLKKYFDLMNKVAVAYNNAKEAKDREELKTMFLSMYDHVTDQGVAYGSCMGNFTHYGYSFRGFYTSYFLMKDVLREAGKLNEAEQSMRWYAMVNEVYLKPTMNGMDMDTFNTGTIGRVAGILMMEDTPEKVQYLKSFSRWINNGCLPANGLAGAFKKDGGAFHHRNLYPAYAVGGLEGASNMIYLLNHTAFSVSELGHETVKNALLTMRFYCNKLYFPLSISGRHPNGKGKLMPMQFALMALAGSPDGSSQIDEKMASAYLRLMAESSSSKDNPEYMPAVSNKKEQEMKHLFIQKGYKAEPDPQGNIALGYGNISVQRRGNWSAVARGHSRYLWAAEHYIGANLYGRYLSHGSLMMMTAAPKQDVSPATSRWQEEGFDWGRIPGTTAIHLPVEQLKANVLNVDVYSGAEEMLYSDEAFSGGLAQESKNGVFGMKLHEHDKYNGSHRARKSYHFFDGKIICLGSDIENTNDKYETETTVFQLAVPNQLERDYWSKVSEQQKTWIDCVGTGYYVPSIKGENNLKLEKNYPQHSRKQDTGKESQGDWVSLTVEHGKAPKGQGYEYVVIPQTDSKAMKCFAKKPTYKVLCKNSNAHIVKDLVNNQTSYVLFETPNALLPKGLIQRVDTSCLVMLREGKDKTVLTVANPDLALYRGASDEKFDENGKRVERSIYSRPWIDNASQIIPVRITLNGRWNVSENPSCKVIASDKKTTVLEFACQDAASFEVELIGTQLTGK
ncbi:MAG: chondroitinase family polysaccharide lyase, partial [Bacteroidaceae bacterium]